MEELGLFSEFKQRKGTVGQVGYCTGKDAILDGYEGNFIYKLGTPVTEDNDHQGVFDDGQWVRNSGVISVTYAQIMAFIDGSNLVIGRKYLITDFRTSWMEGATLKQGDVEPLIAVAITENKLAKQVFSIIHPEDYIEYDVNDNWRVITWIAGALGDCELTVDGDYTFYRTVVTLQKVVDGTPVPVFKPNNPIDPNYMLKVYRNDCPAAGLYARFVSEYEEGTIMGLVFGRFYSSYDYTYKGEISHEERIQQVKVIVPGSEHGGDRIYGIKPTVIWHNFPFIPYVEQINIDEPNFQLEYQDGSNPNYNPTLAGLPNLKVTYNGVDYAMSTGYLIDDDSVSHPYLIATIPEIVYGTIGVDQGSTYPDITFTRLVEIKEV